MASVILPRRIFEKEIGKLDEKMEERIAMLGTPVEKITKDEIEIEIFPNRPDLLSYHGFKRALLAFLGKETGLKKYKINKSKENYKVKVDESLKDIRPYTACAVVKGLKLDSEKIKEIIEIQEKLHLTLGRKRKKLAIGIYPLDQIKFPITFQALEPDKIKFMPLDYEKEISGLEILQKHPAGKEYAHLLSGKARFPVFIDAKKDILSMPPVINSQITGKVTEKTKDIFVECSGFDFNLLKKCLNILVSALADIGGEIYEIEVDYGKMKKITPDFEPEVISVNPANVNKLLGLELKENDIEKLLKKMGYDYNKNVAEIPSWRIDILHEVDVIEDVAIAYGYENFIPEIPEISTIGESAPEEILKKRISDIISGLGMQEVSNYHLTTIQDQSEKMGEKDNSEIMLENSKTDYNVLRKNLSHYLLKILAENVDKEFPQKIFETGKIFYLKDGIPHEKNSLAFAISAGNFTEAKQILDYLFRMLGMDIKIEEPKESPAYFIEGRTGAIKLENKIMGHIGEIHPRILRNWRIRMPVALCEMDFDEILKCLKK
ncbi:MAG TPA: phenylalanine--tRNA ligase subunit beta [Candidatus Omnitrophota bacterium]|nr:phenylalanine--tRNA ligase subunit beta [Candidatus Omnitrophota bacterium]